METINYQNFRIEAENICVDYNGKVALYDANLRLKPGQICGLVGMNGAGKTTFFNALTGFVNISKGKIRINGESVRSAQKDQTIAYVPQNEGIDEPFSGVDIRTEKLISELFIQFKNEGKTILLSTHDMIHVREFCDLVLLINKTVVAYGETSEVFTPENITTTFGGISPDFLFGPES